MKEAIETVTGQARKQVEYDLTAKPWLFEAPAMAPHMDAGAAMFVRISDVLERIINAVNNGFTGWTRDDVFEVYCYFTGWLALYEKRTRERFDTASPVHPDEKDPAPEEVEINL